ncbi:hypothetical protein BLA29_010083, partial [Euroglyphus maynei]
MSSIKQIVSQIERVELDEETDGETTEIDSEIEDGVISDIDDGEDSEEELPVDNSEDECKRKCEAGKDGYLWNQTPFVKITSRVPSKNIIRFESGPKGPARGLTNELDLFNLFITKEMIDIIVKHTNEEININGARYNSDQRYIHETDDIEIKALFGILYMAGVLKESHHNIED